MTTPCRTCGLSCDDDGVCPRELVRRATGHGGLYQHLGAGEDLEADTRKRVHHFLDLSERFDDSEPMWVTNGIGLTWGDLRVLAGYGTYAQLDEEINPAMIALARAEEAEPQ